MEARDYFDVDAKWRLLVEGTYSPFIDSLDERGATSRESLSHHWYFQGLFGHTDLNTEDERYRREYRERNPEGPRTELETSHLPSSEMVTLTVRADEEPGEDDFGIILDSLEAALTHALADLAWRTGRGDYDTFRPTYRLDNGRIVFDEDPEGEGTVASYFHDTFEDADW